MSSMTESPRIVILGTGAFDRYYVGRTEYSIEEILCAIKQGVPIKLNECRLLLHTLVPLMTHEGPSVQVQYRILPLPLCSGPVTVDGVKATTVFAPRPESDEAKVLGEMIKECQKLEDSMRARRSGVVLPRQFGGQF